MSGSDDAPGTREIAHRLFAAEFDDATVSYSESDEERAPKYVVTPSGARVNRLFVVGALMDVERVNEELLRTRVSDPTGAFVSYAGQYQPDEMAFFDRADVPSVVALTGKARTYQPEDSDRIYTSVRPESVSTVDRDTYDRWIVSAAESTLERVSAFDAALDVGPTGADLQSALRERGYPESLASGIPLAIEHYGTTRAYLDDLRRLAVDALRVVADERESVRPIEHAPDEGEPTSVGPIPDALVVDASPSEASAATEPASESTDAAETESVADDGPTADESTTTAAASTGSGTPESGPEIEESTESPTAAESTTDDSPATESSTTAASATESASADESADAGESTDAPTDELGDFDAGESTAEPSAADEPTDAAESSVEGEMYELSEEERREIEENHDVGFESAADVGEPGEAGIDVPDAEELAESADTGVDEPADSTDAEAADTSSAVDADEPLAGESVAAETEPTESTDTEDVDLESIVVEAMDELDDGDGAGREAVVAAVVDEYGVDVDDAEDAIESALMSGKCYEPTEDSLKAI